MSKSTFWCLIPLLSAVLGVCPTGCSDDPASATREEGEDGGAPDRGEESPAELCVRLVEAACDLEADCQGTDEEECVADASEGFCTRAIAARGADVDRCIEDLRNAVCDGALPRACEDAIAFEPGCDGVCPSGCGPEEFRCVGSEACHPMAALCDGIVDCPGGPDETELCGDDEDLCDDGEACDDEDLCDDGEACDDEV